MDYEDLSENNDNDIKYLSSIQSIKINKDEDMVNRLFTIKIKPIYFMINKVELKVIGIKFNSYIGCQAKAKNSSINFLEM